MQSNKEREAIRQVREHFGLSLAEVAEVAGLSEATLSYFEAGKRDLSEESMANLQKAVVQAAENKIMRQKDIRKMSPTATSLISTSATLLNYTVGKG